MKWEKWKLRKGRDTFVYLHAHPQELIILSNNLTWSWILRFRLLGYIQQVFISLDEVIFWKHIPQNARQWLAKFLAKKGFAISWTKFQEMAPTPDTPAKCHLYLWFSGMVRAIQIYFMGLASIKQHCPNFAKWQYHCNKAKNGFW